VRGDQLKLPQSVQMRAAQAAIIAGAAVVGYTAASRTGCCLQAPSRVA
jgi:hypothetical protein